MIHRIQRGYTLIEMAVVLIVVGIASAWGVQYYSENMDRLNDQNVAEYTRDYLNAASRYIQENSAAIAAVATNTTPAVITTTMLKSAGTPPYLSSQVSNTNFYGQAYNVYVLQPTANQFQALLLTSGGETIPEASLLRISKMIGKSGGFVSSNSNTVATGAMGGWGPITLASYGVSPGGGHVAAALFFQDGALVSDYVYRNAVAGRPELNSMNTPLNMRFQATENTSDALCALGDASTYGRIAVDTNGAVLSCQLGQWKKQGSGFWKDPVANFAALPLVGNNTGDVRMVTGLSRAFTWNGSSWVALAVDQNGNMTIPNNLTVTNDVSFNQAQINGVVTEGTACTSNGKVARDSNGLILSCQSGIWVKQSGGWAILPLSDVSAFNPQCSYIMNGVRASYVDSSQIMAVQNSMAFPTTATWQMIVFNAKGTTHWAQDNFANATYYGGSSTGAISYSCP